MTHRITYRLTRSADWELWVLHPGTLAEAKSAAKRERARTRAECHAHRNAAFAVDGKRINGERSES